MDAPTPHIVIHSGAYTRHRLDRSVSCMFLVGDVSHLVLRAYLLYWVQIDRRTVRDSKMQKLNNY